MPRCSRWVMRSASALCAGAVEHPQAPEPQDDDLDVADLGQLEQEALRGAEEQRAVEPVGDDVLLEQRVLERCVDGRRADRAGILAVEGGHRPQRQQRGERDADADRDDEVEHDGRGRSRSWPAAWRRCGSSAGCARPCRTRPSAPRSPSARRPARPAARAPARRERQHDGGEHQAVDDRRRARACAGSHVDRGTGDRAGRGHAADEGDRDVGERPARRARGRDRAARRRPCRRRPWPTAGSRSPPARPPRRPPRGSRRRARATGRGGRGWAGRRGCRRSAPRRGRPPGPGRSRRRRRAATPAARGACAARAPSARRRARPGPGRPSRRRPSRRRRGRPPLRCWPRPAWRRRGRRAPGLGPPHHGRQHVAAVEDRRERHRTGAGSGGSRPAGVGSQLARSSGRALVLQDDRRSSRRRR